MYVKLSEIILCTKDTTVILAYTGIIKNLDVDSDIWLRQTRGKLASNTVQICFSIK